MSFHTSYLILYINFQQVLDNGLLVDPHDQKSISDALLKLVSDKQLWARCKQNGLKNIHLFSWSEHCKTYLSRIVSCKPRQPQWQGHADRFENLRSDSPGDSLRDIQDISLNLKFSFDCEKNEGSTTLEIVLDPEENAGDAKTKSENVILALSKALLGSIQKVGSTDKVDQNLVTSKFPAVRKKAIFVVAVDSDSFSDSLEVTLSVVEAVGKDKNAGYIGFILSTSLSIHEVYSQMTLGGFSPSNFDAFICNSGSELYYPSSNSNDDPSGLPFVTDVDYHSHIDYRWGREGLRKTLVRWAASINEKQEEGQIVLEDESGSTSHCFAFEVRDPSRVC